MGHYSVSCAASSIAITGGVPIVMQLVVEIDEKHMPYCLPIYADYNDYGGIKNIVPDMNIEILEVIHESSIDDIISDIQRENFETIDEYKIHMVWFHREIYEKMVSMESKFRFYGDYLNDPQVLNHFGFNKVGEGCWEHPDYDEVLTFGTKNWNTFREHLGIQHLSTGDVYCLVDNLKQSTFSRVFIRDFMYGYSTVDNYYLMSLGFPLLMTYQLPIHFYCEDPDTFKHGLNNMMKVYKIMYCISREVKPHGGFSPQDGEFKVHQELLELFTRVNDRFIKDD